MEAMGVRCISRPGICDRGPARERTGGRPTTIDVGRPDANGNMVDWSGVRRGSKVLWGRQYALFVGWSGERGAIPWLVVIGNRATDEPSQRDIDSFERLCTAFDRTRCQKSTRKNNPNSGLHVA